MKTIILLLGIIAGFISWVLAPNYQKDKLYGLVDFSVERQCFEYHRDALKDPETAYLVKQNVNDGLNTFYIKVKARNAFGVYGDVKFRCAQKGAKFDASATKRFKVARL